MDDQLIEALRRLTQVLADLRIPYFIGGSLASSIHGVFRATADVDIIAAIHPVQAERLAIALKPEFYADPDMIADSLCRQRAFNVIYMPSALKFDLFPLTEDAFHQEQLGRCVVKDIPSAAPALPLPFASPEDTVLAKLVWFRQGGEVSDRQWTDISQVVSVQAAELDWDYLLRWARYLKVEDLARKLLR